MPDRDVSPTARTIAIRVLRRGIAVAVAVGALALPAAAQAPGRSLDADDSAGPVKVCSQVVPGRWRSVTPVPRSWTFLDCVSFSGDMGASHFQLGCLFGSVTPHAPKYAWGEVVKIEKDALAGPKVPLPNCGW